MNFNERFNAARALVAVQVLYLTPVAGEEESRTAQRAGFSDQDAMKSI